MFQPVRRISDWRRPSQRLAELDNAINARADYFEKREQDPAFSGFHRLEYSLFEQRSLDGLAPVAQRLLTDVTALKQQLLAQSLPPEQLVSIVVRNLNSLADVRAASGEEERYSHIDLNGFAANLRRRPQGGRVDAPVAEQIRAGRAAENRQRSRSLRRRTQWLEGR